MCGCLVVALFCSGLVPGLAVCVCVFVCWMVLFAIVVLEQSSEHFRLGDEQTERGCGSAAMLIIPPMLSQAPAQVRGLVCIPCLHLWFVCECTRRLVTTSRNPPVVHQQQH